MTESAPKKIVQISKKAEKKVINLSEHTGIQNNQTPSRKQLITSFLRYYSKSGTPKKLGIQKLQNRKKQLIRIYEDSSIYAVIEYYR